jgi:hypothetical protein
VNTPKNPKPDGSARSPIRPTNADAVPTPKQFVPTEADREHDHAAQAAIPSDSQTALSGLRQKMETIANEFAQGKLNKAQFKAMYARYTEQRTIIEKLIERDPTSGAWMNVANTGHTSYLRSHYAAQALYYIVFLHNQPRPLIWGGETNPPGAIVLQILKTLWAMPNRPQNAMASKAIGNDQWLVLAVGEFAVTMALYSLEPSPLQIQAVRDMHADFERANHLLLERGNATADVLVFPQRGLVKKGF